MSCSWKGRFLTQYSHLKVWWEKVPFSKWRKEFQSYFLQHICSMKGKEMMPVRAKHHCVSAQQSQHACRDNRASVLYLWRHPQFMEILSWLYGKLYTDIWWFIVKPLLCLFMWLLFQWINFLLYVPFVISTFQSPCVTWSLRKEHLCIIQVLYSKCSFKCFKCSSPWLFFPECVRILLHISHWPPDVFHQGRGERCLEMRLIWLFDGSPG